jgi:serine phosphatase RsbU (regulator of sigma subunit)
LWLSDEAAPANVRRAAQGRWRLRHGRRREPLAPQLHHAALALVSLGSQANDPKELSDLVDAVDRADAVAVVLLPADARLAWRVLSRHEGKFLCVRRDIAPEELAARMDAAASLQPALHKLQEELAVARSMWTRQGDAMGEMDEEMRLAARLQRDFLPRRLPEVGPVRFAALYRPLGWVSGDIYDVARLDESHVGFYVADVVGHGLPAALLTMFIKRGLQTKRIEGNSYQIIPPHTALAQLNADLCEQNLTSCQFCTAAYCVLDVPSLTLSYARAGHPEPIVVHADGSASALASDGPLLGVFPDAQFALATAKLSPGDRVILYSDGAEESLGGARRSREKLMEVLATQWRRPRGEMLLYLTGLIDDGRQRNQGADDITIIVMDVLEEG